MRRLILAASLLAAGCATTPPRPVIPAAIITPEHPAQRGALIGLAAGDLFTRFGQPIFQVREGPGVKLQFAAPGCVLDAYLYPPTSGSGGERVTHIDTRRVSGDAIDQSSCVALLSAR